MELDRVLEFRPGIRAEFPDAKSVFLIGERERFFFADSRVARIASLIDGKRTVGDILSEVERDLPQPEALYILDHLSARGHAVDPTPELPREAAAFWHGLGLDARRPVERLDAARVRVRSVGLPQLGRWMSDALAQAGVHEDPEAITEIVVTDDYLRPDLAVVNAEARRAQRSWFLVQPVGSRPLIGPLFRPDAGPCWACMAFWLRNNRPVEELLRRATGSWAPTPAAFTEASVRSATALAAFAFVRATLNPGRSTNPSERASLTALDLGSLETSAHAVVRRPQCPICGDPGLFAIQAEQPPALSPVPKLHCSDGGFRRFSPEQTWEKYQHLVSPISGPVSYVTAVPDRSTELRAVYASGYLSCPRSTPSGTSFDKSCAGKGKTPVQARASALCEALERFSGVWQGDEPRIRATARELGPLVRTPAALTNFSDAQYRDRHRSSGRLRVPEPLDDDVAIDWTPAWSVPLGEQRFVPLSYCYAEAPPEAGAAYCDPCGNGVAAGNCVEEAILQGLLELIERDAAAMWWYNEAARPGVDLGSFSEPYFGALRADYAQISWDLWALDLTHDLGIPVFAALANHPQEDRFAIGFGCHLDARLALQRALTEVNQLFVPKQSRRAPWDLDRLRDRRYLLPAPELAPVRASAYTGLAGADLYADIRYCADRLEAAGLELLVVDKTRPDIGLSVVQTIIPGLRHFWPRFAPGRLYEVPVALGWMRQPLEEAALNPVPLLV